MIEQISKEGNLHWQIMGIIKENWTIDKQANSILSLIRIA